MSSFSRTGGLALSGPAYVASYQVNISSSAKELQNLGTVGTEAWEWKRGDWFGGPKV